MKSAVLGLIWALLTWVPLGVQAAPEYTVAAQGITEQNWQGQRRRQAESENRGDRATVWSGTGQIISGPGSGGTVRFAVEVQGDRYRSLQGPGLDAYTAGTRFKDRGNAWDFQFSGPNLYVTLTRANGQVINFNLERVN